MASIHPIPFVSFVFFCKKDPLGLYALCSAVLLLPFPSVFIRAIRGEKVVSPFGCGGTAPGSPVKSQDV